MLIYLHATKNKNFDVRQNDDDYPEMISLLCAVECNA